MKKAILAATLGLMFATGSAMAQDVSSPSNYTFVEGGYSYINADDSAIDAQGAFVRGSYEFSDSGVYAFGHAQRVEVDHTTFDINEYELGVGYHRALSQRFDGFVEGAGARVETDGGFHSDGYRVGAGVKYAFNNKLEGLAQVNYRDGNDISGETSGLVGVKYAVKGNWAAVGNVEFNDLGEVYNVGVRYSF